MNHVSNYYFLTFNLRKLPKFVTKLFPSTATKLNEKSWNAFPYCKTQLTVKTNGYVIFIDVRRIIFWVKDLR